MKQMTLTPEWVLENLTSSGYADGNGNVSVYTQVETDADLIELALKTLGIQFEQQDRFNKYEELFIEFNFRLEEIQNECPSFYAGMREIDINNRGRNIKMENEQIFEIVKEKVNKNFRFHFELAMDDCSYEEFIEQYFPNQDPDKMQEFKKLSLVDKLEKMTEFFQNNLDYLKAGIWSGIIKEADSEIE